MPISHHYLSKIKGIYLPLVLFIFSFFHFTPASFAQKQKDIELIVECVEYIGDGKYLAKFGYNNPNKDIITLPEDNSIVIYNKGQSKKYAENTFASGRKYNVFSQEFSSDDRCIWRTVLPNGTVKETSANSSSAHCRNSLGLEPIFDGFDEGGVIWPELYYLAQDYTSTGQATSNEVFQITSDDKVLIEIIAIDGKYSELLTLLEGPDYGLSYIVDNGINTLLITGYFPIVNLLKLNELGHLINFVRAVYTPIPNSGTILSQGDSAQGSDVVRGGWNLNGAGLKIGIMSDSHNNQGFANDDVANGNLPDDVVIVKDYPTQGIFFNQRDEGRAMAQIVHDIVPEADLYFRTAMISSGDFARGILELVDIYKCDLIVDDITYITEPYFQDGIIAQAANYAFTKNVYYATSAGNFGENSYEAVSKPVSINKNQFSFLPNDNSLMAHDFGGGVIKQSLSLMPGRYLIKFEWDEPFYTLKQLSGALTDYDIWIVSDDNQLLYTGRRDNVGEDPQEYMAFTVPGTQAFPVNFIITASNMPANQKLKYTVFVKPVAGFAWNNLNQQGIKAGTIVGQANAAGAMTIGAALYTNTPPYGIEAPTIASFSSRGGVQVKNQSGIFENRFKPDFVGPNGVNTSVPLGVVYNPDGSIYNVDGDDTPNFFGTSASAPHNVGIAAQIIEAGKKFYDTDWTPDVVKSKMIGGTVDMGTPGYDKESGHGYVLADSVLQGLANPKPKLNDIYTAQEVIAGEVYTNINLFADGDFFTKQSKILLRGQPIETIFISSSQLSATIALSGDPEISVYTPPQEGTIGTDGGTSEVMKLFDVERTKVTIKSNDVTKYYLEEVPDYSVTVTVYPPEENSYVSSTVLTELGLEISYDAPATVYSNIGTDWQIRPYFTITPDVGLTELYEFIFPPVNEQGQLTIIPLDIKITPNDVPNLPYGEVFPDIETTIEVLTPNAVISPDILAEIKLEYQRNFSAETDYVLSNASRSLANASRSLANASRSLANNSAWVISETSITNQARSLANQARSLANASRSLANGNSVIDVDTQLIEGYAEYPGGTNIIQNASRSLANAARGLANMAFIASGDANITNAARSLANASRSLANTSIYNSESNAEVVLIFDKDNLETLPAGETYQNGYEPITNIFAIHLITGLEATSDEENDDVSNSCWILPGAYISNGVSVETSEGTETRFSSSNFKITYGQGLIYIDPAPLTVIAGDTSKIYGTPDPEVFKYTISEDFPLVLDDDESVFSGNLDREDGEDVKPEGEFYAIEQGSLVAGPNYILTVLPAKFTITPAALTVTANSFEKVYGDTDPEFTYTFSGLADRDEANNVLSGALTRIEGQSVANSPYQITQGGLVANSNYILSFVPGYLTIKPAYLTVNVISPSFPIFAGDELPPFDIEFGRCGEDSGFKNGDDATIFGTIDFLTEEFNTGLPYTGSPGLYNILFNSTNTNYNIEQIQCLNDPGQIYVNPWDDQHVHPRLDCIELNPYYGDSEHPDEAPYQYVAHLYYDNPYSSTVFLPVGERNQLYYTSTSGTFYAPEKPVYFEAGQDMGLFDVYFDGNRLIWALTSGSSTKTAAISSDASEGSARCKLSETGARLAFSSDERTTTTTAIFDLQQITGYPNPVSNTYFIQLNQELVSSIDVSLVDIQGKLYDVRMTRNTSMRRLELDLTGLNKGLYLLKLDAESDYKILKIIKQ